MAPLGAFDIAATIRGRFDSDLSAQGRFDPEAALLELLEVSTGEDLTAVDAVTALPRVVRLTVQVHEFVLAGETFT